MKISIIIPVYKVERYIRRCLLSALDQSWPDLEVLLVDDASPDGSMAVAEEVIAAHPRGGCVTVLKHARNRGLSVARNTALEQASGEYVYFLDSDDYLPLQSMERLAEPAERCRPDFVVGNYELTGGRRNIPGLRLDTGLLPDNDGILESFATGRWYVMAWNKLVCREFLLREGLFFREGLLHEDDLWSFQLACKAQRAYVVNRITYFYYLQPDSITARPSRRHLENRLRIVGYLFDWITGSQALRRNRLVYRAFETYKARCFDRIVYFEKEEDFRYAAYRLFRTKTYGSPLTALFRWRPGLVQGLRGLHGLLPAYAGYVYYKGCVRLGYYRTVLPIKWKQWTGRMKGGRR